MKTFAFKIAGVLAGIFLFRFVTQKLDLILMKLDHLETTIDRIETVADSAVALINGLSQQIKDAGTDEAKLAALTAELDAKATDLAAAVAANTVAEDEPTSPAAA